MWRTQAIIDLLVGDLGGLRESGVGALRRARRKATWMVALDWLAIALILGLQDLAATRLSLGATEQTLLTIGVLAVAVHSGFRLAQIHQLRNLERLVSELEERRGE